MTANAIAMTIEVASAIAHRQEAAAPVGEAAEQRVDDHLGEAGDQEDGTDRERCEAGVVEPQRDEHDEHAEEPGGEGVEPEPAEEASVGEGAAHGIGACASGAAAGRVAAQTASAAVIAPTVLNAARMPTASATAPNMGPRMAPRTAAPNAVPSSSPRRSRGVATVSQASAPAHVAVLEMPWTNRAIPSAQGPSASAKAKLEQRAG